MLESEKKRNELHLFMKDKGIMTNYGAQCIPAMTYYKNKYGHNSKDEFPNAFEAYSCGLAIPLYTLLKEKQIQFVSRTINKFR
jgi:dTDP-4-amino-4,6-dideoxygalactose transaminase